MTTKTGAMTTKIMRRVSIGALIGVTVALIGWDIAAYVVGGEKATLSVVIHDWATDFLIIPFGLGVLMGHLLWPLYIRRYPTTKERR